MIFITPDIRLGDHEIEVSATTSQGPGGQHVNKTATAIQLRFDIAASSLPREIKQRLLARADQRLTNDGVIVIRAQDERSQLRNREAAIERLRNIIRAAAIVPRPRIATRPGRTSREKRMDQKSKRGLVKDLRKKPLY